jgi:hypothetical protein
MLRGPAGVEAEQTRQLYDGTVKIALVVSKPDSSRTYSGCHLLVILHAVSSRPESALVVAGKNVYLQVGNNSNKLPVSSESGFTYWTSPLPEAEATLCFDLGDLDPNFLDSSNIVIYLDNLVMYGSQPIQLGRIEMKNFNSDTADYVIH